MSSSFRMIDTTSQWLSSAFSLGRGWRVREGLGSRPRNALHLYDIEGSPECRMVREVLTALDLEVVIYPCPKGGERFRTRAMETGGQDRFPLLIDPNLARAVYGARSIIKLLMEEYGENARAHQRGRYAVNHLMASLGCLSRMGAGRFAKPSRRPELMLELYSVEADPDCRWVREMLCELELPYLLHNVGFPRWEKRWLANLFEQPYEKVNRDRIRMKKNRIDRVPCLVDPNTRKEIQGAKHIARYLEQHYAV